MTFFLRFITSLIYGGLLIGSLFQHPTFFAVILCFITLTTLWEVQHITHYNIWLSYLFFPLLYLLALCIPSTEITLLIASVLGKIVLIYYFSSPTKAFNKRFVYFLGLFQITIPLLILTLLGEKSFAFVLFFFGIIWLNDSAAYVVGSWFGKRPLAKTISPNKTIEGSLGGLVVSTVVMLLLGLNFQLGKISTLLPLILVTVVLGSLGDLIQSKIKRQCGVKNSGAILPGHGGMYDRIDSTLFAIPLYVVLLLIFGYVS